MLGSNVHLADQSAIGDSGRSDLLNNVQNREFDRVIQDIIHDNFLKVRLEMGKAGLKKSVQNEMLEFFKKPIHIAQSGFEKIKNIRHCEPLRTIIESDIIVNFLNTLAAFQEKLDAHDKNASAKLRKFILTTALSVISAISPKIGALLLGANAVDILSEKLKPENIRNAAKSVEEFQSKLRQEYREKDKIKIGGYAKDIAEKINVDAKLVTDLELDVKTMRILSDKVQKNPKVAEHFKQALLKLNNSDNNKFFDTKAISEIKESIAKSTNENNVDKLVSVEKKLDKVIDIFKTAETLTKISRQEKVEIKLYACKVLKDLINSDHVQKIIGPANAKELINIVKNKIEGNLANLNIDREKIQVKPAKHENMSRSKTVAVGKSASASI